MGPDLTAGGPRYYFYSLLEQRPHHQRVLFRFVVVGLAHTDPRESEVLVEFHSPLVRRTYFEIYRLYLAVSGNLENALQHPRRVSLPPEVGPDGDVGELGLVDNAPQNRVRQNAGDGVLHHPQLGTGAPDEVQEGVGLPRGRECPALVADIGLDIFRLHRADVGIRTDFYALHALSGCHSRM